MKMLHYPTTGQRALTSDRTVIDCQQARYYSEPRKQIFPASEAALTETIMKMGNVNKVNGESIAISS